MRSNHIDSDLLKCDNCNKLKDGDFYVVYNRAYQSTEVCEDCLDTYYTYCDCCCDYYENNYVEYYNDISRYLCTDCLDNSYFTCESCGALQPNYNYGGSCSSCGYSSEYCECNYHYDFKFHSTNHETRYNGNILYYGIELEVGSFEHTDSVLSVIRKWSPEYAMVTEDCSIYDNHDVRCGGEIVMQPCTYNWYIDNKQQIKDMFSRLKDAGYRSYKTGSCGIHIHMCKDAFSTNHLYKFIKMIYEHREFTEFVSQRNGRGMNWCKLSNENNEDSYKYKAENKSSNDKCSAVNLIHNKTLEVRIFRGTLKFSSFYKNIQYLHSLFEFTKEVKKTDLALDNYLKFISLNKDRFEYLYNWLKEKGRIQ